MAAKAPPHAWHMATSAPKAIAGADGLPSPGWRTARTSEQSAQPIAASRHTRRDNVTSPAHNGSGAASWGLRVNRHAARSHTVSLPPHPPKGKSARGVGLGPSSRRRRGAGRTAPACARPRNHVDCFRSDTLAALR